MPEMELPGRRHRGEPKREFMDGVREGMQIVCLREKDAEDRERQRVVIRSDNSKENLSKAKKNKKSIHFKEYILSQ